VLTFEFNEHGYGEAALFLPSSKQPKVLWRTSFDILNLTSTPVTVNGMIYCISSRARMCCIDLESGQQIGKSAPADSGPSACLSLTAAGQKLIILSASGILHIGETTPDGYREIGQYDVLQDANKPRMFWTPPVLCNAKIYCRDYDGDLVCVDVRR
jgi:outer membrane protein assembly factor BamB